MNILIISALLLIFIPIAHAQSEDELILQENVVFGFSISPIGDLNGDGINDIAVGSPYDHEDGYEIGAVYILFLNSDGTVKSHQKISSTQGNFHGDIEPLDAFGRSISNIGDFNGDGINDIAVGAYHDDDGGYNTGAVYILLLNSDGTVKSHQKISSTQGNFHEDIESGDCWGNAVTGLGDLNGDGINDIAVGAHSNYSPDKPHTRVGAVHILFLNSDGTVNSSQELSNSHGDLQFTIEENDAFGISVVNIGDLNGDGIIDLGVGAYGDSDAGIDTGAVHILFLNSDGTVKSHQKISSASENFSPKLDLGDMLGHDLTPLGDLNGDGINDIAVGAHGDNDSKFSLPTFLGGENTYAKGAVHILFLNSDGTVKSHQKISEKFGKFNSELNDILQPDDRFGFSVSQIGDLNGDGINDIAVGSPYSDSQNKMLLDTGSIHFLFLNSNGMVKSNVAFPHFASNTSEFNFIVILILICIVALSIFLLIKRKNTLVAK